MVLFPDSANIFKRDPPAFTQKKDFMVGIVAGLGEIINRQLSALGRTGSNRRLPPVASDHLVGMVCRPICPHSTLQRHESPEIGSSSAVVLAALTVWQLFQHVL